MGPPDFYGVGMFQRRVVLTPDHGADGALLREAFALIRQEMEVPGEFPAAVREEAHQAASSPVTRSLPGGELPDETAVPFVTIDPAGSMDLDQALHIERVGRGYRVRYAIAHVPAFVVPGGAIDAEARRRGETTYLPDGSEPLHPRELSEGAASLLPGQVRPAFIWDLRLDQEGEVREAQVREAAARSVQRLDYEGAQADVAAGRGAAAPDGPLALLREVGERRMALEQARGGASLPKPEQEVVPTERGFRLRFRPPVPIEDWNAQISLMTGMAAAQIMLDGGVGILRTMPSPSPAEVETFRLRATALGVPWPTGVRYGDFLRGLDRHDPAHLALMHAATSLFRGAGYTPFDGEPPPKRDHAALAAPYAHVTAPLRRLVDRFALVTCASLCAQKPVPEWVREGLPTLPEVLRASGRRGSAVARACTDAVEAAVLEPFVGKDFDASVVEEREDRVTVQITEPAVLARASGKAPAGQRVVVRLRAVDLPARKTSFEIAGPRDV